MGGLAQATRLPSRVSFGQHGGTPSTWGAGFGWLRDVSAAAWIGPRLHPFGQDVGSIIPEGFEAYARLFHPVELEHDRHERWSDVALRNGRIVHSEMQFEQISIPRGQTPTDSHRGPQPREGTLPPEERRVLVDILRTATSIPDQCWFGLWEGFGGLDDDGIRERVELPQRSYLLYRGTIDRALESPFPYNQSPNLWWPEDRAWFVATEIDLPWTYVGGRPDLVAALVSDSRLEVLPVALDWKLYTADRVNAALNNTDDAGRRPGRPPAAC
jgi:hypothetical protein